MKQYENHRRSSEQRSHASENDAGGKRAAKHAYREQP
jgi:hypothetical protein